MRVRHIMTTLQIADKWVHNGRHYAFTDCGLLLVAMNYGEIDGQNIICDNNGLHTDKGTHVLYAEYTRSREIFKTRLQHVLAVNKQLRADMELLTAKTEHILAYSEFL